MHRKELWAVLIVVVMVAGVLVYMAAHAIGQVLAINEGNSASTAPISESGWQTYTDPIYGFSLSYPPDWQLSTAGSGTLDPYISLGNPLNGTSTYTLQISIENNSSSFSSGEYVHAMLAASRATDTANASSGPAPQLTPHFEKSYVLTVNGTEAYELYNVFEFDQSGEQIYVAHGATVLKFDFPMAQENPNVSLPLRNNAIAHEIVNTLVW